MPEPSISLVNLALNKMRILLRGCLFIFLVFTLSFSRPFSFLRIGPIFITEMALVLTSVLLVLDFKRLDSIPHQIFIVTLVYFVYGGMHFAVPLFFGNLGALRDSLLFSYVLFFPISFVAFQQRAQLKKFLIVLFGGTLLGLIWVRICIYRDYPIFFLHELFSGVKAFHYSFYILANISFLIPFFLYVQHRVVKFLILIFCAFNLYILLLWGVRSSWLGLIVLTIFLMFVLKKKAVKFVIYLLVIFLVLMAVSITFFDLESIKNEILSAKFGSAVTFIKKRIMPDRTLPPSLKHTRDEFDVKQGESIYPERNLYLDVYQEGSAHTEGIKGRTVMQLSNIIWRFSLWDRTLKVAGPSPIFGQGFGVPIAIKLGHIDIAGSRIRSVPLHNHILTVFFKMGIVGLGMFLFICIYTFLYGFKFMRVIKDSFLKIFMIGCLGSFISWHSLALFFDMIDSPPTSIFLWLLIGLIFATVTIAKDEGQVA